MKKYSLQGFAFQVGMFQGTLSAIASDEEVVNELEARGYSVMDLNQLLVEMRKLGEAFYEDGS